MYSTSPLLGGAARLLIYVKQTDNFSPSYFDYSERDAITVSNTRKMTVLYFVGNQHVTIKDVFDELEMVHFGLKSKAYLLSKCSTFTR